MKSRKYPFFAGLMAVAVILAACAPAATTVAPATPDKVSLQLKWVTQAQFAGYYVALDQGYYKAQNLDVTLATPEHPICCGVKPMHFPAEEFYSKIRFRPEDRRVTPILTAPPRWS